MIEYLKIGCKLAMGVYGYFKDVKEVFDVGKAA